MEDIAEKKFKIENIPAVLYGKKSDKVYLFFHGKLGCKEEGRSFAQIVTEKGWQVLAVDLPGHGERKDEKEAFVPWVVVPELKKVIQYAKENRNVVALRANSIGAYFSMLAYSDEKLEKTLFVSPILNMKKLIENMMDWAGVTASELEAKDQIPTEFGETLDWQYYKYSCENPIVDWSCPTAILYGGKDNLTERKIVTDFTEKFGCKLAVMEGGEHWFHTSEQLIALEEWTRGEVTP